MPSATALDPFEPVIAAGFVIATIALLVSAPPKERFLRAARKRSDMRGPGQSASPLGLAWTCDRSPTLQPGPQGHSLVDLKPGTVVAGISPCPW